MRQELLAALYDDPGATARTLAAARGSSRNAVAYHLRVMERRGWVAAVRRGQRSYFFARDGPFVNDAKELVVELRSPSTARVVAAVFRSPGIAPRKLRAATGIPAGAAWWSLRRAIAVGLVRLAHKGSLAQCWPGDAAASQDLSRYGISALPPPHNP